MKYPTGGMNEAATATPVQNVLRGLPETQRPKTLNEAILDFLRALEVSDRKPTLVAKRQEAIEHHAQGPRALLNLERSALIGSYATDLQIEPLDPVNKVLDVDLLLILDNTSWNLTRFWKPKDGGTKLLQDLFLGLQKLPEATIRIDRPIVSVRWKDMKMSVMPALRRKGGGFLTPSTSLLTPNWQVMDPLADVHALAKANKACRERLFNPLVKFLKCWNRHQGQLLSSFALQSIAFHSAPSGYLGFEFEIPWFFDKLLEFDGREINSPANVGEVLTVYFDEPSRTKIQTSQARIKQAFFDAKRGHHRLAIRSMADLFGKPFPKTA